MYCKSEFGLILLVFLNAQTTIAAIQEKIQHYEQYFNTSLVVEKQDKEYLSSWTEDFQVKMVDVATKYRLEMAKHELHTLKNRVNNKKWQGCVRLYENATAKSEQAYYIRENKCLKDASSADSVKRQAVMQIGKEIRKWRRAYKYLKYDYCRINREPDAMCFSRSMEKDNFGYAFERLVNLRTKALEELHLEMAKALDTLEDCLRTDLSLYLEQLRKNMNTMNRCYGKN